MSMIYELLPIIPLLFVVSLPFLIPIVVTLTIYAIVQFFKYLFIFTADLFRS